MGILENFRPTLLDVVKRLDPDGSVAVIAEVMHEVNPILDDIVIVEGNLPTGNRITRRVTLPEPETRAFSEGAKVSSSKTKQEDDSTVILEDYGEVDVALANLNGNTDEFRASENVAHIEGMTQKYVRDLLYGDPRKNLKSPNGLFTRYSDQKGEFKDQVLDFKGTGPRLTSVGLCSWSSVGVFGIYPKGSTGGLTHEDNGKVTIATGKDERLTVYQDRYVHEYGLSVKDPSYFVRICNIDIDAIEEDEAARKRLMHLMTISCHRLRNLNIGRLGFYLNRDVATYLDIAALEKQNVFLTVSELEGGNFLTRFKGIPIRTCDAISSTETKVA